MVTTTDHQEKCTKSPVQIVAKKLKYLSNQMVYDQFTVKTVTEKENQEDISSILLN